MIIDYKKGETMIRTQIHLTKEQLKLLKRMAEQENKSVNELIRQSVDQMLLKQGQPDQKQLRQKAMQAAGKLSGPSNLSENHDIYLDEIDK